MWPVLANTLLLHLTAQSMGCWAAMVWWIFYVVLLTMVGWTDRRLEKKNFLSLLSTPQLSLGLIRAVPGPRRQRGCRRDQIQHTYYETNGPSLSRIGLAGTWMHLWPQNTDPVLQNGMCSGSTNGTTGGYPTHNGLQSLGKTTLENKGKVSHFQWSSPISIKKAG